MLSCFWKVLTWKYDGVTITLVNVNTWKHKFSAPETDNSKRVNITKKFLQWIKNFAISTHSMHQIADTLILVSLKMCSISVSSWRGSKANGQIFPKMLRPNFSRQQWLTAITFVVVNFCNAMCVSMQVSYHEVS